jgi:CubicO group peptidase (beta-lactamase class C family)
MKGPNVAFANALASDETGRQDWRVTIKIWPHHRFVLPGLFAFVFSLSCSADAQGPAPSPLFSPAPVSSAPSVPEPSGVHDLTKADLETFLDGLLPAQLQSRDIAGAVVAVVKDGQVLLAKGYGYADFAAKKPVVADQTLFRPGSISKVFTATAVLQLVEQGKLDLDRDVNDYLDFAIPKTFAEPITLRRLLTHTAGFEEALKNLFVPSAKQMRPLRDYLIAAMPERIFRPGTVPSYSNYGLTLAGYIVERSSGEPFEKYVASHVLEPLRMEHSSFAQPLPPSLEASISQGYLAAAQGARNFEFVQAAPAGALSTTGADMTRFMLAFLADGTLDGATILRPETVQAMESRQFELHPALHALGLILMEYSSNGQRIVGHAGDTIFFHSDMIMMPEARVGLFISYNSAGSRFGGGRGEVIRAFLNRYFPDPAASPPDVDPKMAQADGRAASGLYTTSRRSESTLLRMAAILGQYAVRSDERGTLTVEGNKNLRGSLKRWREIGPLLYHEVDGPDMMAFRRDENGAVTQLLSSPVTLEQRVTGLASKTLMLPLIGGSLALLIATVLLWPVAAVIRKRYARPLPLSPRDRLLFLLSRIVCILEISCVALVGLPLSRTDTNISYIGDGLNSWLIAAHITGWLAVVGLVVLAIAALRFWKAPDLGWWPRVHATLLLLASAAFISFAWYGHLLSPSLKF